MDSIQGYESSDDDSTSLPVSEDSLLHLKPLSSTSAMVVKAAPDILTAVSKLHSTTEYNHVFKFNICIYISYIYFTFISTFFVLVMLLGLNHRHFLLNYVLVHV